MIRRGPPFGLNGGPRCIVGSRTDRRSEVLRRACQPWRMPGCGRRSCGHGSCARQAPQVSARWQAREHDRLRTSPIVQCADGPFVWPHMVAREEKCAADARIPFIVSARTSSKVSSDSLRHVHRGACSLARNMSCVRQRAIADMSRVTSLTRWMRCVVIPRSTANFPMEIFVATGSRHPGAGSKRRC